MTESGKSCLKQGTLPAVNLDGGTVGLGRPLEYPRNISVNCRKDRMPVILGEESRQRIQYNGKECGELA